MVSCPVWNSIVSSRTATWPPGKRLVTRSSRIIRNSYFKLIAPGMPCYHAAMLATGVVGAVEDPWIRWTWISGHADIITDALFQHIRLTLVTVVVELPMPV